MTATDPVALFSTMERQFDQTDLAPAPQRWGPTQVIEPLWHQRRVDRAGRSTSITIPLAGPEPHGSYGSELAAVLDARWTGRHDLMGGARILSVSARIDEDPLAVRSLVLGLVTDLECSSEHLAASRMAAELRRAVRDLRRGYALPQPLAA